MKIVGRDAGRQGDHVGPSLRGSSAWAGASFLGELAGQDRPGGAPSPSLFSGHTLHIPLTSVLFFCRNIFGSAQNI